MKKTFQLELTLPQQYVEEIAELFMELGALCVSCVDAGDEPLFQITPYETPLWQRTKILALLTRETNATAIMRAVQLHTNMEFPYKINVVPEQDWVRKTQENFPPLCYAEKLWVIPTWQDRANYSGTVITIEPGLAFGTGTHATTALCLEWLATHPPHNLTVMDYGCGSGILAIAALALGAEKAIAIDHDSQALLATENNVILNPAIKEKIAIISSAAIPPTKVTLILANILSGPLIALAPEIKKYCAPAATLLLSGILSTEIERVANAYLPEFKIHATKTRDEWALMELVRLQNIHYHA